MAQRQSVGMGACGRRIARGGLVALTAALAVNLALSGCQSTPVAQAPGGAGVPAGSAAVGPGDANKLLVVDCLLPGQVRKLGGATYLAPRRPIRTVASECEIRGGEYTSYDRADFRTARLVWLPKAQEGDPEAQVYLGEIYEKGLGVAPDYTVAAAWYRKAALQGDSRGAINLGYLYEKGLGVPKDLAAALNWYRKASGLSGDDLQFASNIQATEQKLGELEQQLSYSRQEAAQLKRRLARYRSEIGQREKALQRTEREVESLRGRLQRDGAPAAPRSDGEAERLRRELERQRTRVQEQRTESRRLQQELERKTGALVAALERTRADLSRRESEVESARERQARLESRVAAGDAAQGDMRRQLEDARRALGEATDRLRSQDARVQEVEGELERLQEREQALSRSDAERAGLVRRLERQRGLLQQARAEQARLQRDMTRRQDDLGAEIRALKAREAQLGQALAQQAARSEESNRELAAANERLHDSEQRLAALSAELGRQRAQAARDSARHTGEAARNQAAIGGLERELQEKEAALAREREALQRLRAESEASRRAFESVRQEQRELAAAPPSIEILDPPIAVTRSGELTVQMRSATRERTVVGKVTAPAGLLSLTVNDRREKPGEDGVFQSTIPMAEQKTPVSVVAVDKKGQRASIDFALVSKLRLAEARPAAPPVRTPVLPDVNFGNYHALIIGNNDYANFPNLQSAANDARTLDRVLRGRYGFRTTLLINATRYQILSALNELRQRLTTRDNLLVFYAGHGELDRVNRRGHWLPVDAEPDNPANWISNIAVTDILNVIQAKHILVVADSCYSGALTRASMARIAPATRNEIRVKWLKVMNRTRSRTVLTSGGLKPVLDTGGGGHSVFASVLLRILEHNDGVLDGYRLYRELFDDVRRAAARFDVEQEPLYAPIKYAGHEAGEFFFVPKSVNL